MIVYVVQKLELQKLYFFIETDAEDVKDFKSLRLQVQNNRLIFLKVCKTHISPFDR